MATTNGNNGDSNNKKIRYSDIPDKNEIGNLGKIMGGILLILFTITPLFFIIALWPDRMPTAKDDTQLYINRLFHVAISQQGTLHINIIMFLLVALAGFTGNMVHVATSFTNYVGSEKFKRSWLLWYFVKPFTASAVAVIFYLVLKAGLLNFDGSNGANPFGIVILSALAGLYTDKAMLKLEEIFVIIFKPKDDRPDKLETELKITGITPQTIEKDKENSYVVAGENLDKVKLGLFINDEPVANPEISATTINFKYTIPETQRDKTEFLFVIKDEQGQPKFQQALTLSNDTLNNLNFPADKEIPSSIEHHDESNISNQPPANPPPNIR
ncbi:MAG: hypothetical protein E6H09_15380 [Bacteroidetes bacterium]|nr:MAG: hypothetical protein E6H09_15380 [Bacteroidota bacterium]